MNIVRGWMNPLAGLRGIGLTLLAIGHLLPVDGHVAGAAALLLEDPVRRECGAADRDVHERQHESVRCRAHRHTGCRIRRHPGPGRVCAHLRAVRSRGHGGRPAAHGTDLGRRHHGGRRGGLAVGERLRRPDRRVQPQPDRPEGAEDHSGRPPLRTGLLARRAGGPRHPDRRIRQQPAVERRAEPLVRPHRLSHRLAAGRMGAGPSHDPGVPAGRLALRRQHGLRRQDPGDRSAVPDRRAPDARLHRAPLGVARCRLVQRRRGDRRRGQGREARQLRLRSHARLPDQRQPRASRSATSRRPATTRPTTCRWTCS